MASSGFSGALRGLGSALVQRTRDEREDKLRSEDRAHQDELEMRQQAFQRAVQIRQELFGAEQNRIERESRSGEAKLEREHEGSMLFDVIPAESGEDIGFTRGGERRGMGVRSRSTQSGRDEDGPGMTASEQRAIDDIKERYTTTDDMSGKSSTDWNKVVAAIRRDPELAHLAGRYTEGENESGSVDVESPEYLEAKRIADEEVSAQAGYFRTDATDFKDDGGNRETSRARRTDEHYRRLSGRNSAAPSSSGGDAEYDSAEAVRDAMRAGKLTREQALSILRSNFGYQ